MSFYLDLNEISEKLNRNPFVGKRWKSTTETNKLGFLDYIDDLIDNNLDYIGRRSTKTHAFPRDFTDIIEAQTCYMDTNNRIAEFVNILVENNNKIPIEINNAAYELLVERLRAYSQHRGESLNEQSGAKMADITGFEMDFDRLPTTISITVIGMMRPFELSSYSAAVQ